MIDMSQAMRTYKCCRVSNRVSLSQTGCHLCVTSDTGLRLARRRHGVSDGSALRWRPCLLDGRDISERVVGFSAAGPAYGLSDRPGRAVRCRGRLAARAYEPKLDGFRCCSSVSRTAGYSSGHARYDLHWFRFVSARPHTRVVQRYRVDRSSAVSRGRPDHPAARGPGRRGRRLVAVSVTKCCICTEVP
jgi:hypothetical protein